MGTDQKGDRFIFRAADSAIATSGTRKINLSPFSRAVPIFWRGRILLGLGAAAGLGLALTAVVDPGREATIPADAIATLNGSPIRSADFERALGALAADRRDPIGQNERRLVLDRLIEEELLLQRARTLGLDQHDRGVRERLVAAMMETAVADGAPGEPSEEEVAAFYERNAPLFAPAESVWVREIRVGVSDRRPEETARGLATAAVTRLRRGETYSSVVRSLADPAIVPLPEGLLPVTKLREYLGPSVTEAALRLGLGEVSDPLLAGSAFHVLQIVERKSGAAPPLGAIEKEVRAEMRRQADDRALRSYLDELRRRATVRMREP
jgi:hypothetical protein